jgi:hypothetical protein
LNEKSHTMPAFVECFPSWSVPPVIVPSAATSMLPVAGSNDSVSYAPFDVAKINGPFRLAKPDVNT